MSKIQKRSIGSRMKTFRLYIKLTQAEMALKLNLDQTAISAIEKGKSLPSIPVILHLMRNYHLSVSWLLTGFGNMLEWSWPLKEVPSNQHEYHEEMQDLFFHLDHVPIVRQFMLEQFTIFKLKNKKEIREWLEKFEGTESRNTV